MPSEVVVVTEPIPGPVSLIVQSARPWPEASWVPLPSWSSNFRPLIVVGVGLDTIAQIEAHLVSRQYEGFVKGTRLRGRLGR